MTAINVLLQPERGQGWLITDAAWYDVDGVVHGFAPKSQAVGHWPGAIATRGPGLANAAIASEAGLIFDDFDAFADGAADFLEGWCARNGDHLDGWREQGHVEVVALGWSKSQNRVRAIFVGSRDDVSEAAARGLDVGDAHAGEPFNVLEIESGYVRPLPTPEGMAFYGVDPEMDFNLVESLSGYGLRVLCAQRELREPIIPGGDLVCFVGGYLVSTTVNRNSVFMTRGAAFPDKVGQRIDAVPNDAYWPEGDSPPAKAVPPPGMTRQQRRAWEAQQRKNGGGKLRPVQ